MESALQELVEASVQQAAWLPPDSSGLVALAAFSDADASREAEMVPHDGYLAIGELSRIVCGVAAGRGWALHYDEDGFATAVPSQGEAVVLEDRLRFRHAHLEYDGRLRWAGCQSVGVHAEVAPRSLGHQRRRDKGAATLCACCLSVADAAGGARGHQCSRLV